MIHITKALLESSYTYAMFILTFPQNLLCTLLLCILLLTLLVFIWYSSNLGLSLLQVIKFEKLKNSFKKNASVTSGSLVCRISDYFLLLLNWGFFEPSLNLISTSIFHSFYCNCLFGTVNGIHLAFSHLDYNAPNDEVCARQYLIF